MSPAAGLASISLLGLSLALRTKLRQEVGRGRVGESFLFLSASQLPLPRSNHVFGSHQGQSREECGEDSLTLHFYTGDP